MKEKENQVEQWEYTSLLDPSRDALNYYGREGWEAYFVEVQRYATPGIKPDYTYYLKRKKGGAR